ncbi:MAG: prephenate dehydrogenase [Clostridia bacterium]|jgi:prephenate dehydrogenase
MIIGIVGIGLIGGSLAKAYKSEGGNTVYGYDTDKSVLDIARAADAIDEELNESNIGKCDFILIAIYPKAAVRYLKNMAPYISKSTLVMDCCGTKRMVCKACFEIAKEYGFTFAGGHPMAGRQSSGFKYSSPVLFKDAYMIVVPDSTDNIRALEKIKQYLKPMNFKHITITSAEKHDEMIAFTSQMAHIVSNAYIKSPTAKAHKGFSAGSYKDLTRVAYLNEDMWTELFMENSDNLIKEMNTLICELEKYRDALTQHDDCTLKALLAEGKKCKEEVDGL